ncbi:MAG TPA: PhoPQ-activated pathogenicity-related family protein [Blastocatellia bacterium]
MRSIDIRFRRRLLQAALCAAAISAPLVSVQAQKTALDRYVAKPDTAYSWKLVRTAPGEGYKVFVLQLTSQHWRTGRDVDRPIWKHWLTIVKPDKPSTSKALLFIGGGNNSDKAPETVPDRATMFALESNSVVAELGQVPNQPLFFTDSKEKARYEDDLIAYTRVKHFSTRDDEWLVRLAMVKSGVRAMDAVQAFLASDAGGGFKVDQFVVSGGSKRGWTTWLVGAVDDRVIAIMPTVIDALNSEAVTRHHFESYGFFSPALDDYVNHGLFPHKIGTPEYGAVLAIEDPYNYRNRERLKIPKYLVNASGDQFFLPDNSRFYFDELKGEKHLRYAPNAKHNLAGSDARESMLAFYMAVIKGKARPRYSWKKEKDGSLTVKVVDKPKEVNLWRATNPKARDFRVDTIGNAYAKTPLSEQKDGVYVGRVDKPAQGFTAYFIELVYDIGEKYPLKFTTGVSVTPDALPYKFEDAKKKYSARN